jgi:hypothetical protein
MTIEQRPGTERPQEHGERHLVGSPSIKAEWSGGDSEELPRLVHPEGKPHGKASSWLVVGTVFVAFAVAGVALIFKAWPVIWVCVAIIALMIPVAMAVRIMDDTVGWARPTPGEITRGDMTRTAMKVREEQLSGQPQGRPEKHRGRTRG